MYGIVPSIVRVIPTIWAPRPTQRNAGGRHKARAQADPTQKGKPRDSTSPIRTTRSLPETLPFPSPSPPLPSPRAAGSAEARVTRNFDLAGDLDNVRFVTDGLVRNPSEREWWLVEVARWRGVGRWRDGDGRRRRVIAPERRQRDGDSGSDSELKEISES